MASNGTVIPLLIGGERVKPSSGTTFPVFSYEQNKVVHHADSADANIARQAAETAQEAFKSWKNETAVKRRELLQRYANALRAREEDLISAAREETSAPLIWCKKNVQLAANLIEETAACITSLKGEIPQTESPERLALVLTVPVGPVLTIAPWNAPIILGARNIATPVAAGCTVVFKASELSPKTHHLLVDIFESAGLPKGVINIVHTDRDHAADVTEALIAHPAIRKVEFVGSASIGKVIGQVCAKYLKPIFMELGGKGPAIVLEDADLPAAAKKCILGAFFHHGQVCFSTERIVVLEKVSKEFQSLLVEEAKKFKPSSSVSERILKASQSKLEDAQKKGVQFLHGSADMSSSSSLTPTIYTGLTKNMAIHDEEAFGPSVALLIARDDAHAIQLANDTPYGLNAAVHSRDFSRALRVAKELDHGQIHINNITPHDEPTIPIGGTKGSGWGRNNAIYGLKEFCELKTITFTWQDQGFLG